MSRAFSPSVARCYGLARVARVCSEEQPEEGTLRESDPDEDDPDDSMSLAAIEAELKPKVLETFDAIADTFKPSGKPLQALEPAVVRELLSNRKGLILLALSGFKSALGLRLLVRGGIAKMLYAAWNRLRKQQVSETPPLPLPRRDPPVQETRWIWFWDDEKKVMDGYWTDGPPLEPPGFRPNLITATMSCRLIGCFLAAVGTAGGMAGRGELVRSGATLWNWPNGRARSRDQGIIVRIVWLHACWSAYI